MCCSALPFVFAQECMMFNDYVMIKKLLSLFLLALFVSPTLADKPLVGVYYFDGWAGRNRSTAEWAKNAPTHLTEKLTTDFSDRTPVWGWRDDDLAIMEKQIDLAADNGVDYFLFCWYWRDDQKSLNEDAVKSLCLHSSIELFLRARNHHRMKFSLLIANHSGARIEGEENWKAAVRYWGRRFFQDEQYLCVDGKPVVTIFLSDDAKPYIPAMRKEAEDTGLKGLYLVSCNSWEKGDYDMLSWYNCVEPAQGATERPFADLCHYAESRWDVCRENHPDDPILPCAMAGWDARPWEGTYSHPGSYYVDVNPKDFAAHIGQALRFADSNPDSSPRFVNIYAWNELGEGGYLVPTQGDPKTKLLKALRKVKKRYRKK